MRPGNSSPGSLKPSAGITIMLVSPVQRELWQPGLTPRDPTLISRHQLIGRIQAPQVDFDFVAGAAKHRRTTTGTKKSAFVIADSAANGDSVVGKNCRRMEQRSMMFAAIQTVANTDPIRQP
jgi:hypothetical protein